MKAVLMSIQPKWVEKIASGKKTIEARKTKPKIDTPFKCYIYKTKKRILRDITRKGDMDWFGGIAKETSICSCPDLDAGKVIGEFVCDNVIQWNYKRFITMTGTNDTYLIFRDDLKSTCLTYEEFESYGKGETLYGWHITDLKIYDKPKELSEFTKAYPIKCGKGYESVDCTGCGSEFTCTKRFITRPPQSWCYVEVEND